MALETAACADEYFIKRGLFPNVDFYSGITLTAMGIPTDMFTVLFGNTHAEESHVSAHKS